MPTARGGLTVVLGVVVSAAAAMASGGERASWLRTPAISPDGATVVFSYRGHLWKVPSSGGAAVAMTTGGAYDSRPVFSPDGSKVAFASDRHGNDDVFVMAAGGGEATRLTTHSADDWPVSFTPDGAAVLFVSARLDAASCVQFPSRAQPELYRVALAGGAPVQVLSTPALHASFDRAGARLAYSDVKGYEMEWRKHDTSSFTRDVWLWDREANRHTRLTADGVDDRDPVWSPDERALYYLSERSGSFNVWKLDLADPTHPTQVTSHATHPVRFLSASSRGDLCYTFDGELWVRPAGAAASRPLEVEVSADGRETSRFIDVAEQVTEFDAAPSGKELAFVARGDVFAVSAEHGTTRQITRTPEQERSVSFAPDGRSLVYAGERGGSWNVYRAELTDPDEPNFFNATAIKETAVVATAAEEFQPLFSPDGAEVAYLEDRTTLRVVTLASGAVRTVLPGELNYSYSDGDQWYRWSPDGRSFAVQFLSPGRWSGEVGIVPSSGRGTVVNVSRSGYEDGLPTWAMKGEVLLWATDRHGARAHDGWGREQDVYAAFLTRAAWDRYRLDAAELEQLKEKEKAAEEKKAKKEPAESEEKKGAKGAKAAKEAKDAVSLPDPVALELDGIQDRIVRLSLHSASIAAADLSPDGETLYYLARFEKGYDLWKYTPRKKEVKVVAKLDAERADFRLDREGKKAYVLADKRLSTVELESGKPTPVRVSARMQLDPARERAYLFEHAWRQTLQKFYDERMHGVDWAAMRAAYARFLPHIDNDRDFAELISEMQGELNASHTGGRFRPRRPEADDTAWLGFFPDPAHGGDGVRVLEVVEGGPLQRAGSRVKPGVVLLAIDGEAIAAGADWHPLLNHKAGAAVRLSLLDPASGARWEQIVKPVTGEEHRELLYRRWVRARRADVERLSGGRIGYAHIRDMDDGGYREIFDDIFGKAVDKEAIVLDTRWNGGGNLVEPLTAFLSGRIYARDVPRGREIGTEPLFRWTRPSIVVMNEGNYSDAHCFPMAYTQLGIGETVGMQVPGTCTSVWWERLQNPALTFGIPEVGLKDVAGDIMENKHLDPTWAVDNDPAVEAAGRDQQLEKAVEVLLAKLPAKQ